MKLPRRQFLHLAAGAAALPAASRIARAQAYPSRPVRLIVPFGPAGATDITARLIGQWLSERLGQQFVIENRPVAGIIVVPNVMVVNPSVPAKTVPELIAYAKANPGKINMASGPIGGSSHVS